MDDNKKNFNKNHQNNRKESVKNGKVKKQFDKKAFRDKMYNKKVKIQKWDDQRRKKLLRDLGNDIPKNNRKNKGFNEQLGTNSNKNATIRWNRKSKTAEEELNKAGAKRKAWQEKKEALEKYKQKRTDMYKVLSRKTKFGQPVMKGRMELLLQKIQQSLQ